jgi:hypothetical protein
MRVTTNFTLGELLTHLLEQVNPIFKGTSPAMHSILFLPLVVSMSLSEKTYSTKRSQEF